MRCSRVQRRQTLLRAVYDVRRIEDNMRRDVSLRAEDVAATSAPLFNSISRTATTSLDAASDSAAKCKGVWPC